MAAAKPMSVFEHWVAHCAIAHQTAMRAARDQTHSDREVSMLTVAMIRRLHRLQTLYAEMGGGAVFGTPTEELGNDEIRRLFPDTK